MGNLWNSQPIFDSFHCSSVLVSHLLFKSTGCFVIGKSVVVLRKFYKYFWGCPFWNLCQSQISVQFGLLKCFPYLSEYFCCLLSLVVEFCPFLICLVGVPVPSGYSLLSKAMLHSLFHNLCLGFLFVSAIPSAALSSFLPMCILNSVFQAVLHILLSGALEILFWPSVFLVVLGLGLLD